jgi:hypothetical protein
MTPIDKANDLIVKVLIELDPETFKRAQKIALKYTDEMISEVELLRVEDPEYKAFQLRFWKSTKNKIEKL